MAIFAVPAGIAHAETRVGGYINSHEEWSAAGSPYLLTSHVTVADGAILSIGPGVVVRVAPESKTEDIGFDPAVFVTGGDLHMDGSVDSHVTVDGVGGIFVAAGDSHNGVAHIKYSDLRGGSRLSFDNSDGTIATSTIRGADMGLYTKDSVISMWGSAIEDNSVGIYVQPHQVFLLGDGGYPASIRGQSGVGGIGNALSLAPDRFASSSLDIHGSSFIGNTDRAIMNNSELTVDARSNWWGNPSGPMTSGENSVRGDVAYAPWLSAPPAAEPVTTATPCCSSVLFIPGLEGSRLYRVERRPLGLGTSENQLWEPNRNADVKKLFMDSSGASIDRSIYSGGPIDKALGFVDIYGGFMRSMDKLVDKGVMNEWRPFGYDWRKPVAEVVDGPEKRATSTESLMAMVATMALSSRTGKVTIVAHSNGGLVAKYLVKKLADAGRAALIDSVISVAVPFLGTPVAIPALLHGEGQSILGGLIASAGNMAKLGLNMPSAYSLLPSREFFAKAIGPTIVYASTTADTYDKQASFIASRANKALVQAADFIHGLLDPFVWPANIARWAVVGWNNDRTPIKTVESTSAFAVINNPYGDGTVKAQSAAHDGGETIPLDLKVQSNIDGKSIDHVNILGASTTKTAIADILSNPSSDNGVIYSDNPATHNTKVINELSKLPGVTVGDMDWNALDATFEANRKELRVSTHSPVKLHIYDSHGNHTGEILPPAEFYRYAGDESEPGIEEGLYTFKEEKVPGSSYEINNCDDTDPVDCDTYITLPDNGEDYTAVIEGAGVGTFTLDIERIRATSTVEKAEWSGVPTTPLATATTTFKGYGGSMMPAAERLASSTAPLKLDLDGDGASDSSFMPGRVRDSASRLDLMKRHLASFMDRHRHFWFRELKIAERASFKSFVDAFRKKFGRE